VRDLGAPGIDRAEVLGAVAAEEGAAHTARDDVVGTGLLVVDQETAGQGHDIRIGPY